MSVMSLYNLIQGESIVPNCTASYWSVFVYPGESHDRLLFGLTLIGQFRSYDLIKMSLQFSTELSSSGINYLKQDYSLILVYDFCSIGYGGPIFHKIGNAKAVDYPIIRGVRGYHSGKNP